MESELVCSSSLLPCTSVRNSSPARRSTCTGRQSVEGDDDAGGVVSEGSLMLALKKPWSYTPCDANLEPILSSREI